MSKLQMICFVTLACLLAGSGLLFANGDTCAGSVFGVQSGTPPTDGYTPTSAFTGTTNHLLYYDYICPGAVGACSGESFVDSTASGCQTFAGIMLVNSGRCSGVACINSLDWANNNTCTKIKGCDGFDDDGVFTTADRTVFSAFSTGTSAPYTSTFLVDSVAYNGTTYEFNNSVGTTHDVFTMTAPSINTATCNGTTCNITVKITEPTFNATGATGGIYGDDAGTSGGVTQSLLAGYKIVAVQSAAAPANGLTTTWTLNLSGDDDRYIPATQPPSGGTVTSNTITVPVSGGNSLYIAYVPMFNYSGSGCNSGTSCTQAQVKALDAVGFVGLGFVANSLSSRIASAASQPIVPTPVTFSSFTAQWAGTTKVALTWVTATESNSAGFNVYHSIDGVKWVKINTSLIPAKGVGGAGATYTFGETIKGAAKTIYYRVDEVSINNAVTGTISTSISR